MRKRNIYILILAFVFVLGLGIGLGVYIEQQNVNPRAAIPNIFTRILIFFVHKGVEQEEDLLYYDTNLSDFIVNGSPKTKVKVEGVVDKIIEEPDGDYHVVLRTPFVPLLSLVTEFIPEIRLPMPQVGDDIRIWGITRFDIPHNWWELHPVIGWEKVAK